MSIKISFTLDSDDLKYFQQLLRDARKYAHGREPGDVIAAVRGTVGKARQTPKLPGFAAEAIDTLESLIDMVEDADWALPKAIAERVTAALAYFAHPQDLIPDHVPGLGFLDDAIMIKIIADEFEYDLDGYREFRRFRDGAEQRPWTNVARERLPRRLKEKRDAIREKIDARKGKRAERRKAGGFARFW
jgi:uncharacterized membrane protein YkvA (DUF1232 family)